MVEVLENAVSEVIETLPKQESKNKIIFIIIIIF